VQGYVTRLVDPLLDDLMAALPAVLLVGPRASGKTTTAARRTKTTLRLDRRSEALAVAADPDVALTWAEAPVLIDEWQLVEEVLGAVKRAVDDEPGAGRFLLTGSTAADMTAAGRPATGRVIRVPLWGFNQRELAGNVHAPPFLSRLFGATPKGLAVAHPPLDLRDYVELALRGGFPELARQSSPRARRSWLAAYVDGLVTRDAAQTGTGRDPVRLRRYLEAAAANTAGVVEHKTLHDAAGINRLTALAYDTLLEMLFVTERLPAWTSHQLGRLVGTPKRYLTEPALLGPLLGLDSRAVLRNIDLLDRVLDTFVTAQLRSELAICNERPRLFHIREPHGRHKVDLIAEAAGGRVVGFEIKATSAPGPGDARHLVWLRERLGDRFVAGVVFHTGPHPFPLGDRLWALPISAIWS